MLKQAPAFSALESRLSDLARRVESHEKATNQNALPDLLKEELTELAGRIDTVRDTAESLAQRAQTQAVQSSQKELRAIEQRIVGLIKEAQLSLSGNHAAPAEMQRLRTEIERLNQRIDEAHAAQASGGDVMALKAAVEQLSTRVAQGPDMRPLADMDKRILDITQRLEQTQEQSRGLPAFTDLERRIAELDHKLNEAVSGRGSSAANELEGKVGDINSRIAQAEQQLTSMATLERAINQIYDSMEQQKQWTQEVANEAAGRMAQNVLAAGPQQVSLKGAPEIIALQEGLQAVRSAAETADQRNQETLEAVHETLEQIVGKLAELETAAIGQRVAAAASPSPQPPAAPVAQGMSAGGVQWQAVSNAVPSDPFGNAAGAAGLGAAVPAAASVVPGMPNTGFGAPQAPSAAAPEGDDFIAAARRAAQASYQQKGVLGGVTAAPGNAAAASEKKRFSLFSKSSADQQIVGAPVAANGNEKRRKLLLMGLVLLAAVSAFTFNIMGQRVKAPVTPTAVEQSVAPGSGVSNNPDMPAANPDAPPAAVAPPEGQLLEGATPPAAPKPQVEGMLVQPDASDPMLQTGSLPSSGDMGTLAPDACFCGRCREGHAACRRGSAQAA